MKKDLSKYWVGDELLKVMFPSGISYEQLSEKTLEKSVNLLSYQFAHYEPMSVCLKTAPDDFKHLFRKVLQDSYDYTYIAREVATDQVIGVLAGNYFQTLFHRNIHGVLQEIIPDKLLPIADIIGELEDTFVSRNPGCFTKTPYFYIYALAIAKKYVDSGISIKLSLLFESNLIKHSIKNILTISSVRSVQQFLLHTHRFREVEKIRYEHFKFKDSCVFKDIEHTKYCAIYKRLLSSY